MRSWLAFGLLVSCGGEVGPADAGGADGTLDAPFDAVDALDDAGVCVAALCEQHKPGCIPFPTGFDDSCTTTYDCVVGRHGLDCCGSQIVLGLASSAKPQFDLAEKQYFSGCGGCSCLPNYELTTSGEYCLPSWPVAVDCLATDGGARRCITRCLDASDQ